MVTLLITNQHVTTYFTAKLLLHAVQLLFVVTEVVAIYCTVAIFYHRGSCLMQHSTNCNHWNDFHILTVATYVNTVKVWGKLATVKELLN